MSSALVGHTGFVGGQLQGQTSFDDCYNSKNIYTIEKKSYDTLVCAGARAEKWLINKNPMDDLRNINILMDHLSKVEVGQFILISTVDVYPQPIEVDEDSVIERSEQQPYGQHRLLLENFVEDRFKGTVIRLPALFGKGLKKNILYDLLHNNRVEHIHSEGIFQFYNLAHLWADIQRVLQNNIKLINFATEPVSAKEIAQKAFGMDFDNKPTPQAPFYNFKTKHAQVFRGERGYMRLKNQILKDLKAFVSTEKKALA